MAAVGRSNAQHCCPGRASGSEVGERITVRTDPPLWPESGGAGNADAKGLLATHLILWVTTVSARPRRRPRTIRFGRDAISLCAWALRHQRDDRL